MNKATQHHLSRVARLIASFRTDVPAPEQEQAVDNVIDAVGQVGSPYDAVSDAFAATRPATEQLNDRLARDFAIAAELFNQVMANAFGLKPAAPSEPPAPPKRLSLREAFMKGFNVRKQPLEEIGAEVSAKITASEQGQKPRFSPGIGRQTAEAAGKFSAWAYDPAAMTARRDLKRSVKNILKN